MTDDVRKDQGLTTADIAGRRHTPQPQVQDARVMGSEPAVRVPAEPDGKSSPLFASNETQELRSRWDGIQAGFVDEPRKAVEQADALVAGTMKRLAEVFAQERSRLEGPWSRGDDVSTEDLRVAFQRYRSFFTRLLSM
jgi:hypothetical protein